MQEKSHRALLWASSKFCEAECLDFTEGKVDCFYCICFLLEQSTKHLWYLVYVF